MAYRSIFPLRAAPLCAALVLVVGGAAAACTNTVIENRVAPPADAGPDAPVVEEAVPDAGGDVEVPFVVTPPPDGTFPQGVNLGGSVVKAPKVVPIIFTNDPQKQSISDFTAKLAKSTYWGQISSEYGVGALTAKAPIILTEAAPVTIGDDQIAQWLVGKFSSDAAHFGAPDPSTLYAIYYPPSTTVADSSGKGCTDFGGYHNEANVGGTRVGYAVMPRCASFADLVGTEVTTFTASHEILEWATDPLPQTDRAYGSVDTDHAVWGRVFQGELGDLCAQLGDVSVVPEDLGFKVQRMWSNASAKAGHHPCVPVTAAPYFTAFPTTTEAISATDQYGRRINTRGFKVGVGEKKTIELTLYSDAAIASWTVQIFDLTKFYGSTPEFSYTLDKTTGKSGDKLQLTITGEQPVGTTGQGFVIASKTKTGTNLFPVWVTN